MIANIPSEREFLGTGLSLLGFGWEIAVGLLTDLDEARQYGEPGPDMVSDFWEAAGRRLLVASSVSQQAVEFMLKARIAAVSPFLLISGNPRDWPRSSNSGDIAFADFRMIDAQDLVRVHDSVAPQRLDSEFVRRYEELRKRRNAIVHTVDSRLAVQVTDVVVDILQMYRLLFPTGNWVQARREFLEKSPLAQVHSSDFVEERIVWEFQLVLGLLTPRQVQGFFGVPAEQRRYICPVCTSTCGVMDVVPETAVLCPDTAASTSLFCFVCGQSTAIDRCLCPAGGCDGDVIHGEDKTCLTCGHSEAS